MEAEVYRERRRRVMAEMGEGVMVLFSAPVLTRNNDVHQPYRQHSDFYYLTGFDEPESALVLQAGERPKVTLFLRPRDPAREQWDGARLGADAAKEVLLVDAGAPIEELPSQLGELFVGQRRVFHRFGEEEQQDSLVLQAVAKARSQTRKKGESPSEFFDHTDIVHEMRRVKGAEEIEAMRGALKPTADAHIAAMKTAKPGRFEYEVEAEMTRVFRAAGSERVAYQSIVGSGANATVLHYIKNDQRMESGQLLLIDAGAELGYYASDITRTFPIAGKFSPPQKKIYELVLRAQLAAIEAVRPGASFEEVHQAAARVICAGLMELGWVDGPLERAVKDKRYRKYFMHGTGHYLGMDVHDVGKYYNGDDARVFEPGVVLTVEPGIYIASDDESVPEEYRGIGVRIEDDILVTLDGAENLSQAIPKTVAEVEALTAQAAE